MFISARNQKLSPLLKYPGGKDKELPYILPKLPKDTKNYYEPFVGGGAVFFAVEAEKYFINDKSEELIDLYTLVKEQNADFLEKLAQIDHNWRIIERVVANHSDEIYQIYYDFKNGLIDEQRLQDQISALIIHYAEELNGLLTPEFNVGIQNFINELIKSIKNKIVRIVCIEQEKGDLTDGDFFLNIECAFKASFYMHFRYLYNNSKELNINRAFHTAIYFYIREFCYSSMFRYNENGKFNVPYGGISYNRKYLSKKISYFQQAELREHLSKTLIACEDFQTFLRNNPPSSKDFIFLDPPYDTEFSTYAKNSFDKQDQIRLADYLQNECPCRFMLIIKNTEFICNLYQEGQMTRSGGCLKIESFEKKYFVSFQNRNNKIAEHLIITNY